MPIHQFKKCDSNGTGPLLSKMIPEFFIIHLSYTLLQPRITLVTKLLNTTHQTGFRLVFKICLVGISIGTPALVT
jgi:hypothetical protein